MKLVIGLVGEKGGGKGTFISELREVLKRDPVGYTMHSARFSSILTETLALWGIPVTRENLQKLPVAMNKAYGEGTLTRAVKLRAEQVKEDIAVLDGVRWKTDEELIRSFPKNCLIYITADPRIRYERMKKRKEKVGEEDTTFRQFMKEERAKTELLIPEIGAGADTTITNNKDLKEFQLEVSLVYATLIWPILQSLRQSGE